jgi:hypothetical protein
MALPLEIRNFSPDGSPENARPLVVQTRDVGHRGLYFHAEGGFKPGMALEFVLTLPKEVTLAGDVHIRCFANIVRVDPAEAGVGVAARIERYDILAGPPQ